MSSNRKPGISLALNKIEPVRNQETVGVFGGDSDEEESQITTEERFNVKYGGLKAREEKAVQKVIEEDPSIYDYDAAYEKMEKRQVKLEKLEHKEDVERKSKYINKFIDAKKKRELETLLRDERKQAKEREAEGNEFKDKDVFITSAYRKQLEETLKFRKQLEDSDRVDEMTNVKNQKMWQENFNKKLLEDRVRDREVNLTTSSSEDELPKPQPETKVKKSLSPEITTSREHRRDDHDRKYNYERRFSHHNDRRHSNDRHHEYNSRREGRRDDKNRSSRLDSGDRTSSRHKDQKHRSGRDSEPEPRASSTRCSSEDKRRQYSKTSNNHKTDRGRQRRDDSLNLREVSQSNKKKGIREAELEERNRRMEKIREILQQHNTSKTIAAARERYFERRNNGLISSLN